MTKKYHIYSVWFIALSATCLSLYFSEILRFPPCTLCWYQRICMYPILLITTVGILNNDRLIHRYVLPLAVIGLGISVYHNLLYYGLLPESIVPCTAGISCTTKFIEYFGFVTIPLLSMIAFVLIIIFTLIYKKPNNDNK